MFAELANIFSTKANIDNESSKFYYQDMPIKPTSCKYLGELGIENMSLIEVETNLYNSNRSQSGNFNAEVSHEIKKNEIDEYKEKIKQLEKRLKDEQNKVQLMDSLIKNLENELKEEKKINEELRKNKEKSTNLNEYNKIILEKEKKINIL